VISLWKELPFAEDYKPVLHLHQEEAVALRRLPTVVAAEEAEEAEEEEEFQEQPRASRQKPQQVGRSLLRVSLTMIIASPHLKFLG
jgi:hypothetical protein